MAICTKLLPLHVVVVARRQGPVDEAWTRTDVRQSLAAVAEELQQPLIAALSHLATLAATGSSLPMISLLAGWPPWLPRETVQQALNRCAHNQRKQLFHIHNVKWYKKFSQVSVGGRTFPSLDAASRVLTSEPLGTMTGCSNIRQQQQQPAATSQAAP